VSGSPRSRTEWLLLLGFCGFLFFFGLNYFGLVGADEPRYAQIAREMLARHDWITPILGGQPWLEKPVLYYWQAMLSYSLFGVSDWAARIPSALDATLMVIAAYLFLRRLRPGFHLDGALMIAASAAVVGFARAAATDMPLAASFTVAMLAWFAWFETGARLYLAPFYVFLAFGALAKGPVALLLAGLVILVFLLLQRNLRLLVRLLWIPGVLLFCAVALPWYVMVQLRNPEFFRVFILEHNLARFGTGLYHHQQPFWYFVPVILLALVPWTVFVIQSLLDAARLWWSEGRKNDALDPLTVFLVTWLIVPVVFFSFSQSKLPGYILPAVPAGILLVAEYVRTHVDENVRPPLLAVILHSLIAAAPVLPALMINRLLTYQHGDLGTPVLVSTGLAVALALAIFFTLRSRYGLRTLRLATLVPVVFVVAAILKLGGPAMDSHLSARVLSSEIAGVERNFLPAAVFQVPREIEYGLAFYRNQVISNYGRGEIPPEAHLLVAREGAQPDLGKFIGARRVSLLGTFAPQHIDYYWVSAANATKPGMDHAHH
jgi:4-amino-4-deoxy-L-arabinose transferase-like glycosyltransferase